MANRREPQNIFEWALIGIGCLFGLLAGILPFVRVVFVVGFIIFLVLRFSEAEEG